MTQKAQLQSAGDGTAVPSGYVGQYLEGIGVSTSLTAGQYNATSNPGVSLTPGVWAIQGFFRFMAGSGTSVTAILGGISTSNANDDIGIDYDRNAATLHFSSKVGNNSDSDRITTPVWRVVVTSNTTYYPKIRAAFTGGSAIGQTYIFATRIA